MSEKLPTHNPNSYDSVLSRLEQKIDNIATDVSEIKFSNTDLVKRVTVLEGFKLYIAGVVAVCSSLITFFLNHTFKDK